MIKHKQTVTSIFAIALIAVGAFGGFIWRGNHVVDGNAAASQNAPRQRVEASLTTARNTAIVQAVKRVGPAVVGITAQVYTRDPFHGEVTVNEGIGSGIIFEPNGYIVTNAHVVGNAAQVTVSLADGKRIKGTVVGRDSLTDLAVVKVTEKNLPVAVFGDSNSLQPGETAIAIGSPLGLEFQGTVTAGVISSVNRAFGPLGDTFRLIQTDAAINPGNSGGALVDATGKVIGINSAKIAKAGVEGLGFAIPVNAARPILKELIENGKVRRPYLGFFGMDRKMALRFGLDLEEGGVLVYKLVANGPLARAGVHAGDVLVRINERPVPDLNALQGALNEYHIGEKVTVHGKRQGRSFSAAVVLTAMPDQGEIP